MRSRLCALNFDLIRDMKAKFHNRPIPAGEITKWFKSNPQQLDGTGISIDQISTDHIIPKSVGGYDHLFNYYIMPKGHNSHFKDKLLDCRKAGVRWEAGCQDCARLLAMVQGQGDARLAVLRLQGR